MPILGVNRGQFNYNIFKTLKLAMYSIASVSSIDWSSAEQRNSESTANSVGKSLLDINKNRFKSTRQIRHNCVPMLFTSFSPHLFLFLYLVIKMSFFLANTTVLHKQTDNSIIDVTNLVVPSNERKK